jgi:hypothetical protein
MTWLTSSITWIACNDPNHVGDPVVKLETGFAATARMAMKDSGWGYDHELGVHVCPTCITYNVNTTGRRM